MNPSKLSPFLFTLSLILISQAHSTNLYEDLCGSMGNNNARCLQVMKADARIASAGNMLELCKLILELAIKKSIEGQNYLKEVMKTNPSPAIVYCATTAYGGVVGSFKSSLAELSEDSLTANYDAKVASDKPGYCNNALAEEHINNTAISALNNEISFLSEIAFYATDKLPMTKN